MKNVKNLNDIHQWKKEAHGFLEEIEGKASVYGHQKSVIETERPSIFYTVAERKLTVDEALVEVKNNLPGALPKTPFSEEIVSATLKLISQAREKINSLTSLFVCLETNWGSVNEKYERVKFYDHYHPPRGNKNSIATLSYFSPMYLHGSVTEKFEFCDLTKLNLKGRPAKFWINNKDQSILDDFSSLANQTSANDWRSIEFPSKGALEIEFDSFHNLHNLTGLSENIFLTIVINDVEFRNPLKDGELNFRYFNLE